ncbi:MAG: hypothetical protein RRY23_08005, partial [Alistipes sp.]
QSRAKQGKKNRSSSLSRGRKDMVLIALATSRQARGSGGFYTTENFFFVLLSCQKDKNRPDGQKRLKSDLQDKNRNK